MWYISIPLLQVVASVTFSKCFNAFINTIVVFKLKNTERKSFTFSRLVLIKKSIFSCFGECVFIWFGISWSKKFLASTSNIRLLKGKSVANVFMTAFHKVKLNPVVIKLLTSGNFYQHLHFFSPHFRLSVLYWLIQIKLITSVVFLCNLFTSVFSVLNVVFLTICLSTASLHFSNLHKQFLIYEHLNHLLLFLYYSN